jgi:serine/threonine protein kinase
MQAELPNKRKLAVMKISPRNSKQQGKNELQGEISKLKSLDHENLVPLLGGYPNKDLYLLVNQYMQKGSLQRALFGKSIYAERLFRFSSFILIFT